MAHVAPRPHTGSISGILALHPRIGLVLAGLLALPLVVLPGCNSGSRNPSGGGGGVLPPPVDYPVLEDVTPSEGRPGDVLSFSGRNFAPAPEDNIVLFTDSSGTIEIAGKVESVTVGPFDPDTGASSLMTVRVPSAVRSGFIAMSVFYAPANGFVPAAGGASFNAAPVILGCAINDNGQGVAIRRDPGGNVFPDFIQLLGINFGSSINDVTINDGTQTLPADSVAAGAPATITYDLGGLEAITVELPGGLLPSGGCQTSVLEFTAVTTSVSGQPIESNPFEVPFGLITGTAGNLADMPAHFTGMITPAGIRTGDVEVTYNLFSDPAQARWDVQHEFQDPSDPTGTTFLPCTPAPGSITGALIIPGPFTMPSQNAGIIGPGATLSFVWDSAADIPPGSGTVVTRLRMRIANSTPLVTATPVSCAGQLLTEFIVIDNDAPTSGSILEEFADNDQENPAGTADWNPGGSGVLTATGIAGTPTWGTGTVDVVLQTNSSYILDADFGFIVDSTDALNPVEILSIGQNPGAADGEFHVRTLEIQSGANLSVIGTSPLVFRCSGDGDDDTIVAVLAGTINLNGQNAVQATETVRGLGGAAGPGGGAGGDGGFVVVNVNDQNVSSVEFAEDGEFGGGEGGSPIAFVTFPDTATSLPRGASGGGGGHAFPGEAGINTYSVTVNATAPNGKGGLPFGDSAISFLRGGSGGGGGGATPIRLTTPTSLAPKHGGGGGGGGGAFAVIAQGTIQVLGSVSVNGGNGSKGSSGNQPGAGGGGAGGSILFRATGDVALGENVNLSAIGGFGAITQTSTGGVHRGGNGSVGRIRIEANGQVLAPGIADFDGVSPPMGSTGITSGPAPGSIDIGTGIDGPLDETVFGLSGTYRVDTALGKIFNSSNVEVFSNSSGTGTFELTRLNIPEAVTLIGEGPNPLILKVTGLADVRGVVDVSGQDGGIPVYTNTLTATPGAGGAGGAGGGSGGAGGTATTTDVGLAGAGGMPPTMPPQLIDNGPPIGGGGGGGVTPGTLAVPAQPGESTVGTGVCNAGAGGGGGYTFLGESGFSLASCPVAGDGGTPFGSTFFLVPDPANPPSSILLLVGGGGGAGGGGFSDGVGTVVSPGSGGGGAGGFFQISSGGQLKVHPTASIFAVGGDAYRAAQDGGNAGAGAGGAIRLQGQSRVEIDTGSEFDVRGGLANQVPAGAGLTYTPNSDSTGGDGSSGRIRVETPLGFADGTALAINPALTSGLFATAGLTERIGLTLPYRVSANGVSVVRPVDFDFPIVQYAVPLPAQGAHVIPLFQGAFADPSNIGAPGPFFGLVDDPSLLQGVDFVRGVYLLYASQTEQPVIESIELPFD